jgi:proteic killer suppression protein
VYTHGVQITYENKKIEKLLSTTASIKINFGKFAQPIRNRLSELQAVETLDDISPFPPPCRHKLEGEEHTWALNVSKNWRLIIRSTGEDDPKKVKEVIVSRIEDYH